MRPIVYVWAESRCWLFPPCLFQLGSGAARHPQCAWTVPPHGRGLGQCNSPRVHCGAVQTTKPWHGKDPMWLENKCVSIISIKKKKEKRKKRPPLHVKQICFCHYGCVFDPMLSFSPSVLLPDLWSVLLLGCGWTLHPWIGALLLCWWVPASGKTGAGWQGNSSRLFPLKMYTVLKPDLRGAPEAGPQWWSD